MDSIQICLSPLPAVVEYNPAMHGMQVNIVGEPAADNVWCIMGICCTATAGVADILDISDADERNLI